ncbi:MaoC family dehydratase [Bradyrhizobium sp.]|uniref:MaoC family dehydratase n=1 Tax=Bradyrhizobium sp. TaxID=376 RepID=UPI003C776E28
MPTVRDLSIDDLQIGMNAELVWNVEDTEIDRFASISGDVNPMHVDARYARARGFENRVAHGFLLGSKVSAFVGTMIPGRRCLLLEETLAFPNPVYPGDRIVISGQLVELWPEQALLKLKFRATKMNGEKSVIVGRGTVLCQIRS